MAMLYKKAGSDFVSTWLSVAQATVDLRRFLSDGPLDRPVKSKQVVGVVDGANKVFFAFDDRLIPGTLRPTVDYTDVAIGSFAVTDAALGIFTLTTAPTSGQTVRARYYFQYFLDEELDEALELAAGEITESDDITTIASGFKQAALNFAGHFAYQKLAIKWAQRMSQRFLLEEEPLNAEILTRSNMFRDIARDLRSAGLDMRDDFYKRHGRRHAPSYGMIKPNIPPIGPRR